MDSGSGQLAVSDTSQLCRSVLAMRQRVQERHGRVQAVLATTSGGVCSLHAASTDCTVRDQLQHSHQCKGNADAATYAGAGARESASVRISASRKHLLVLPGECNVTGARPSQATLDALCAGRIELPGGVGSTEVRWPARVHRSQ